MRRYWWTVWIKVAVLGVALFLAVQTVRGFVSDAIAPYLLDTPVAEQPAADETPEDGQTEDSDLVASIMSKVQGFLGVNIDYEQFIYDFANGYAQQMIEDSEQEHNAIKKPLS